MRTIILIFFFCTVWLTASAQSNNFLNDQKKNKRVREAYTSKEKFLKDTLSKCALTLDNIQIIITAFKEEKELDIWLKQGKDTSYKKIFTYGICDVSGNPGPKSELGDGQIPEGFYHIDRFNPTSDYYLSLGINYPNQADRLKNPNGNSGGDIFIHGNCVTIGCLPMTDDKIKEIYILALQARANGQNKIPVYIFPFRMTDENFKSFSKTYSSNTSLPGFWKSLKTGYDIFLKNKRELVVSNDKKGRYVIE
ncbi:MAG: L,D-transpeptidase family protein [Bacteroidia bacterium]|nr:L,D-transpeptidase family protein [Bacteroidia bacterium]